MKEFDKIIKEKLSDIDSPYASDTWANIQKGLPKKKKRPYGLFFMTIFLLLMLSIPVVSHYSKKLPLPKSSQIPLASDRLASVATFTQNGTSLVAASESKSDQHLSSSGQILSSKAQSQSFDIHISANKMAPFQKSKDRTVSTNAQQHLTEMQSYPDAKNEMGNNINETQINTLSVSQNKLIDSPSNDNIEISRQGNVQLAKITLPSTGRVFGTDQSHLFESVQISMKKNASLPCPTFVRKQNLSFIEFYFANDYGIRNMTLKNSDQIAYLNQRNNTEFPFFSYSAGTRFGIGWESGIAFKSGLDYTQVNEKFVYTDPNSIQKKTITLIKYIYDSNFNVVDSTKTVEEVEIPGTNKIVNYNKYRFVDIPVLFQYTIPGKKRLSYSITAGPFINISFTQSGKVMSADNKNLIDISDKQLYKDNIGLSLYTALAINYQLTKTTQIVFEPNVRYIPNSISQLKNPIDQNYLIASIAAGFRYKI